MDVIILEQICFFMHVSTTSLSLSLSLSAANGFKVEADVANPFEDPSKAEAANPFDAKNPFKEETSLAVLSMKLRGGSLKTLLLSSLAQILCRLATFAKEERRGGSLRSTSLSSLSEILCLDCFGSKVNLASEINYKNFFNMTAAWISTMLTTAQTEFD